MCYNVFACGDYFWCQPSLYFITFVQSISKRSPLIESWSSNQPPRLHRIWCFHEQKLWQNSFNMEKIMGWKRGPLSLSQICIHVDVSMMVSGYDLVSLEAKQGPSCGLASGPCAYNAPIEIDTSFLFNPLSHHDSSWSSYTFWIWLIIDSEALGIIEFQYDEHKEVWNPESRNRCKFTEVCEIWHICLRGGLLVNIAHTAPAAGDIVVHRWLA